MNVTFLQENSAIRVEFEPDEVKYLARVSRAVAIPLETFGGLTKDSPYVDIRIEQLCSFAETNMDVEAIVDKFGVEKRLSKLESLPEWVRKGIRSHVVRFISDRIPKGFFMKK